MMGSEYARTDRLNVSRVLVPKKSRMKRNSLVAASLRCLMTERSSISKGYFWASAMATCRRMGSLSIWAHVARILSDKQGRLHSRYQTWSRIRSLSLKEKESVLFARLTCEREEQNESHISSLSFPQPPFA